MNIIVNMACGLANRMFQYSYYLWLNKQGYTPRVDYYISGKLAHENVLWSQIFPRATYRQASQFVVWLLGGGDDLISKIRRHYLPFTTRVQQMPTAFSVDMPLSSPRYMMGVFQNAKMVESIREEILDKFEFPSFQDAYNQSVLENIQNSNSVAIHVRKGKDYQSGIWYQHTCLPDYYQKAVELMKDRISNPRFFVFTDNQQWVKENFMDFDYTLVGGNPGMGWGCHFDMQLMSMCKHSIMSNSTYSWWGTFLNKSTDKLVVIPKVWFNPGSCDDYTSENLLCKDWIQL